MPAMRAILTLAAALALAALAGAQDGVRLELLGTATAGLTGDDQQMIYGGRLAVDGPVAGALRQLRIGVELDLSGVAGETPSLADASTWGRGVRVRSGLRYTLARRDDGISTSAYLSGGFLTAIGDEVLDRYLREFSLGVEFAVDASDGVPGARLRLGYCRSEEAGYIGAGQVCLSGHVPLGFTRGALVLGGDATLNLSRAVVTPQRDVLRLYVGASLPEIVSALRR